MKEYDIFYLFVYHEYLCRAGVGNLRRAYGTTRDSKGQKKKKKFKPCNESE